MLGFEDDYIISPSIERTIDAFGQENFIEAIERPNSARVRKELGEGGLLHLQDRLLDKGLIDEDGKPTDFGRFIVDKLKKA